MARGRKKYGRTSKISDKRWMQWNAVNDVIQPANDEAPRTRDEQKILNTRLRLALRTGALPFRFIDDQEKHYRKIIYSTGVEVGKKFTANKGWQRGLCERWNDGEVDVLMIHPLPPEDMGSIFTLVAQG